MDIIGLAIFGAAFFYFGWVTREIHAKRVVARLRQEVEEIVDEKANEFKKNVINIKVEDHDGQFFIYKKDDGSYLAHAETMSKLEDILNEKFPGKMFNATPEDLKRLESR